MALFHIPLDQIDEARLRALIDAKAAEGRTIDFKLTTYGNADKHYTEFLADVSSFANTVGGDLVLGMEAKDGIATALRALTTDAKGQETPLSMDSEILRLDQIARGGLQPRIANIAFQPVPLEGGGDALIIRIPRSFNIPHRVIRQHSNRFWARTNKGKYEPDVDELRRLFNAAPQLVDRIRNFRLDRIAKIAAEQASVPLVGLDILALHLIPMSAFDLGFAMPLRDVASDYQLFFPIGSSGAIGTHINFDGILKTTSSGGAPSRAYVQLYRNGILETVASEIAEHTVISNLPDKIINEISRTLMGMEDIGIGPPYVFLASLIGVSGTRMNWRRGRNSQYLDDLSAPLDRDQYHFDEVIIESIPADQAECARILRPLLDQIANAAGRAVSPVFDAQGLYIPPN